MNKKLNLYHLLLLSYLFSTHIIIAQIDIVPATAAGSCNGSATLTNSLSVIQSSVNWYNNGNVFASNTFQVGNLCDGYYNISFAQTNPAGGIDSLNYGFIVGIGPNPCSSLNGTISQTPSSTPTSNDGIMTGNASGGNPPYLYMWSNGAITQDINNILPGLNYCLIIQDAANCEFGPICDTIQILDPSMGDTLVVNGANCGPTNATVYTQELEDCNFDFNACASANLYYIMPIGNDSIQANWNFIDTNGLITNYTINYYAPNPTSFYCYNLQFTLFCSVIKSSNIKTIVVTDAAELISGIDEKNKHPFSVNNPIGNELCITFDFASSGILRLFNLNGQLLKKQFITAAKHASMSTAELPEGTYILQYENGSETFTEKVIK
jgi:hypothetical protein